MRKLHVFTSIVLFMAFVSMIGQVEAKSLEWSGNVDVSLNGYKQKNTDNGSNITLDEVSLTLNAQVSEKTEAVATLKYEEEDLFLDEAYLKLSQFAEQPFTVTAGKWVLPFGVFNSNLIFDPLTQDKYEINAPAVSFAYTPEELPELELSFTLYANEGALFTISDPNDPGRENDLGNYILSASMAPAEFLKLSVYYDSEQGTDDRNDSLGFSINGTYENLTVDAEYITALQRNEAAKESAYSLAAAYQLMPDLKLASRFEGYNDDVPGVQPFDEESLEGLEYRVSVGAGYNLDENTTLSAEYRVSEVEDASESNIKEWTLQLSIEF